MAFGRRRSSNLTMTDLSPYRADGDTKGGRNSVDVDEASRRLGVSKTAVRDIIRTAKAKLSDTVLRGLTGRGDADRTESASSKGLLQAAFGRGRRGGAVNARAASDALGVSQGTVRRWASGTQQPSGDHLAALKAAARRVTSTKSGRKATADAFRNSSAGRASQRGDKIRIFVYAYQGPIKEAETYRRDRTIYHDVDTTDIEAMLRAYEEGGDDGFRNWLTDRGNDYMNEGRYTGDDDLWEFTDIYDIRFEDRT